MSDHHRNPDTFGFSIISNAGPGGFGAGVTESQLLRFERLVNNAYEFRRDALSSLMDPRRDLAKECGYPEPRAWDANQFRDLYEAEPLAARVCQLLPNECWQVTPKVYETEGSERDTEFEKAWDGLGRSLRGTGWFQDEEGSPVWEYLRRLDRLSGIGAYGILLLGLDDGLDLSMPVDGVVSYTPEDTEPAVTNSLGERFVANVSLPTVHPSVTDKSPHYAEEVAWAAVRNDAAKTKKMADAYYDPNVKATGRDPSTTGTNSDGLTAFEAAAKPAQQGSGVGTDAQYAGVQLGPSEYPATKPSSQKRKLRFLRVYSEDLVQIVQYEANAMNPRFGQPVMYRITLNDPRNQQSGIGLPLATVRVHWSRVIHAADNRGPSEVSGVPRMRPVLRPLLDAAKIRGAASEGYWRSGFPGLALETVPQLGGDVRIDRDNLRNQLENYFNTQQRSLTLMGMSAKTLSPNVTDPTPFYLIQIQTICIQLGCPQRVFMGSERGELASSQDDSAWNDRLRERQNNYLTPLVIVPFIDRLIMAGVLPEPKEKRRPKPTLKVGGAAAPPPGDIGEGEQPPPGEEESGKAPPAKGGFRKGKPPTTNAPFQQAEGKGPPIDESEDDNNPASFPQEEEGGLTPREELPPNRIMAAGPQDEEQDPGYSIEWPDLDSLSDKDKAAISLQQTQAIAAYIGGNVEAMVPPLDFLIHVVGWPEEQAVAVLQGAATAQEQDMMTLPPPGEEGHPATIPTPPPPAPGMPGGPPLPAAPPQKLGAGQSLVDPSSGKEIAKGPPSPKPPAKGGK